jgi:hypothetical protein
LAAKVDADKSFIAQRKRNIRQVLGNSGKYITLETSKSNGILKVCFSGAGDSRMQEL